MDAALERDRHAAARTATFRSAPAIVAAIAALGVVLVAHGFLPGMLSTNAWDYLIEGGMRCMAHTGALDAASWCHAYGRPVGYPYLTSGPIIVIGSTLMRTTGVGSYAAYVISGAVFDAVALAGGYGLLRCFGVRRAIALAAAVAYLVSPTIVGLRDFGGTFTGMTLLPALALVDLVAIRTFERGNRRAMAVTAIAYAAIKTGVLFLDGYAFTISALITCALWLWWSTRSSTPLRIRALGLLAVLVGHVVAGGLYRWYTPPVLAADPIAVFRSMGLDVTTLVLPSRYVWGPDLLGASWDHSTLWGDGTNSAYNYIGLVSAVLAVLAVTVKRRQAYVLAIAAAGLVALLLSLGPALKVDNVRGPLSDRPTGASYLMPASAATVELPWDRAFRVPGLAQMRATYRWSAATRLALVILAALGLEWLWLRPERRAIAVIAAVLAVIELVPNVPLLVSGYRDNYRSRAGLDATVVPDLRTATRPGETVFFVSPDEEYNDYLANYLAPTLQVKAYNAGGDKNSNYSRSAWPTEVSALTRPGAGAAQAVTALRAGAVDAIVVPYFHLRWASYSWPPTESSRQSAIRHFAPMLNASGLAVRRYRWFATLRLTR